VSGIAQALPDYREDNKYYFTAASDKINAINTTYRVKNMRKYVLIIVEFYKNRFEMGAAV
jgi:hypothetical protein